MKDIKTPSTVRHEQTPAETTIAAVISTPKTKPASIWSFDDLPDSAFIRESQLVQSHKRPDTPAPWPFSAPTYWRKIKAGTLPKPFKLSERVSVQNVGECRAINAAWAAGMSEMEIKKLVAQLHAKRTSLATA
jgi:prophage regulatory protein